MNHQLAQFDALLHVGDHLLYELIFGDGAAKRFAFVIFEPLVGGTDRSRLVRGLDSIELAWDGTRWWIAAITTDFEGPGKTIPAKIGRGG